MTDHSHMLAIMFADISGSTALFEKLGDVAARRIVAGCLTKLTDATLAQAGTVIKSDGDDILCTFPTAQAAVKASVAMHEALERVDAGQTRMGARIGINYGPVLLEGGDIYGDTVNVAARVAALTKVNQTLCTVQVMESLGISSFDTRYLGRMQVKGKQEEIEIHEIIWKHEDVTSMGGFAPKPVVAVRRLLRLVLDDQRVEIGPQRPSVTLGRKNADLVTAEPLASRMHAKIEYRSGKFMIKDQSTNGTFVRTKDGREVVLHLEEFPLQGSGSIGLGCSPDPESPHVLHFDADD